MMYSATKASSAGNNCSSSRNSRPGRRPLNRRREKANAAHAPMKTAHSAPTPEMISEFLYQVQNGRDASVKRLGSWPSSTRGEQLAVLSVPPGFVAAE